MTTIIKSAAQSPAQSPQSAAEPSAAKEAATAPAANNIKALLVAQSESTTAALVARFFEALDLLIERRVIRGKKTFCDRYGINRWNFYTCKTNPCTGLFKLSWLTYMVRDYGVSADWLLVGRGVALPPLTGEALRIAELYKQRKTTRSGSAFLASEQAARRAARNAKGRRASNASPLHPATKTSKNPTRNNV